MVENKLFIVDASVALKWFLVEREGDLTQAFKVRDDFFNEQIQLLVPMHFFVEFFNIVFRKVSSGALTSLSDLQKFSIPFVALSLEIASIAGILMKKYPKVSFYDAFYHALAIEKEGTFVTADEQYYKMVKKEGHILLLKDYL